MQLTKNFNLAEFNCRDGRVVPDKYVSNVKTLAENLQVLRDHIGEPIHLNSCYRPPDYNKKVGGKPASQHLTASAADITTKSHTPKQLAAIIEKLITTGKMKQGGLGIYPGFVHYDIRGKKARW
jgi:uncharacterized protein YcbK (DUF882 family)